MSPHISRCRCRYIQCSPNLESKCLPVANHRAATFCENINQLGYVGMMSVAFCCVSLTFRLVLSRSPKKTSCAWWLVHTWPVLPSSIFLQYTSIVINIPYFVLCHAPIGIEGKHLGHGFFRTERVNCGRAVVLPGMFAEKKRKLHMNSMM